MNIRKWLIFFVINIGLMVIIGCGGSSKGIQSESVFDTPKTHYEVGMEALKANRFGEAEHEFQRAIELAAGKNEKYAPAHEGLGLVYLSKNELDTAEREMKTALDIDDNHIPAYIGLGRIYTARREHEAALRQFDKAINKNPQAGEAYFYKGAVYEQLEMWDEAEDSYEKALNINPTYTAADQKLRKLQERRRATAGLAEEYQKIAQTSAIDRADAAVLLTKNLPLEQLFGGKIPPSQQFEIPGANPPHPRIPQPIPDIQHHWAKPFIKQVVEYGLIELYPDGSFHPDEPITKGNYAMIIEKVLAKALQDDKLTTQFFGTPSPFPDVMNTHYAFNSVMVVTTRGVMKAKLDGTFGLDDSVSGTDAILILKALNEQIK